MSGKSAGLGTSNEKIIVQIAERKSDGKRKYDRKHFCYFCEKFVSKIGRHLKSKIHQNETEVARVLAMDSNDPNKKKGFLILERAGDFNYNCDTIQKGHGELIVVRRLTRQEKERLEKLKKYSYRSFGPCPRCLGFMLIQNLWHHMMYNCPVVGKEEETGLTKRQVKGESWALATAHYGIRELENKEFQMNIIAKFLKDDIGDICKNDPTILTYGYMLYEKCQFQKDEYVRCKMREIARLVQVMKSNTVEEFLSPLKFDDIIRGIHTLCDSHLEEGRNEYGIPSLALKLGHSIRKCCAIVRGKALRHSDMKLNRAMQDLLALMDLEFESRVSSTALATLYRKKVSKEELLPVTEDLVKLNAYLHSETKNLLINIHDYSSWRKLAEITLARIILFNKRRSGEAARMLCTDYSTRPQWNSCSRELLGKIIENINEIHLMFAAVF